MYYTRKPINFQRQFSKLLRGIIDRWNIGLKKTREREREREWERMGVRQRRRSGGASDERARGGQERREREREREKEGGKGREMGFSGKEDDLIERLKGAILSIEGSRVA